MRVFSLPVQFSWSESHPCRRNALGVADIYPEELQGGFSPLPMCWTFGLLRAVTKLCAGVDPDDAGIVISMLFDVCADDRSCEVTLRVKATETATRFLMIFLRDYSGWNSSIDFPYETKPADEFVDANAEKLPPSASNKNVCSVAFSRLHKKLNRDSCHARKRFWWASVERLENVIFATTLALLREDVAHGHANEWTLAALTQHRSDERRVFLLKEVFQVVALWASNRRSVHPKPNASEPSEPLEPSEPSRSSSPEFVVPVSPEHERLRRCNFPIRSPTRKDAHWTETNVLSGCVFGPVVDDVVALPVPFGMVTMSSNAFYSIW